MVVVHEDVQMVDVQYGNDMVEMIGITVKIKIHSKHLITPPSLETYRFCVWTVRDSKYFLRNVGFHILTITLLVNAKKSLIPKCM